MWPISLYVKHKAVSAHIAAHWTDANFNKCLANIYTFFIVFPLRQKKNYRKFDFGNGLNRWCRPCTLHNCCSNILQLNLSEVNWWQFGALFHHHRTQVHRLCRQNIRYTYSLNGHLIRICIQLNAMFYRWTETEIIFQVCGSHTFDKLQWFLFCNLWALAHVAVIFFSLDKLQA